MEIMTTEVGGPGENITFPTVGVAHVMYDRIFPPGKYYMAAIYL